MSAIMISLLQNVIKYIVFIIIAVTAVICGKKFRDYKDSKRIELSAENKESK